MKKEIVPFVVGLGLLIAGAPAIAATAIPFSDNFNRSSSSTVGNGWVEDNSSSDDVAISSNVLRLRDDQSGDPDAAVTQFFSTTGLSNVQLSFDWKQIPVTGGYTNGELLLASYCLGSCGISTQNNWIDLGGGGFALSGATSFSNAVLPLPVATWNNANVGIRLWTDLGGVSTTNEGALVDNVSITASPAPEPEIYAMMLAGLGLMGFVARRRQRYGAA